MATPGEARGPGRRPRRWSTGVLGGRSPHERPTDQASPPGSARAAVAELGRLFPRGLFEDALPPIVLRSQVYSLVPDRTAADRQLVRRVGPPSEAALSLSARRPSCWPPARAFPGQGPRGRAGRLPQTPWEDPRAAGPRSWRGKSGVSGETALGRGWSPRRGRFPPDGDELGACATGGERCAGWSEVAT